MAELEIGHVGVARRYPALKCAGEFVQIDTTTKRPKRRGPGMSAAALRSYGVATAAKFGDECLAVTDWILRLR